MGLLATAAGLTVSTCSRFRRHARATKARCCWAAQLLQSRRRWRVREELDSSAHADNRSVPPPTQSARSLLVHWANQQDSWIRALVGEVVRSRRQLGPDRLEDVFSRLLIEKDLAPGIPQLAPPLELGDAAADVEDGLSLVRLDAVSNVNALTTGQSIAFNEGLTVVFGKNGAGKSGYVRVFKRLAAVRGAAPILPNVHLPTTTVSVPRARVTYRLGTTEQTVDWNGEESGIDPLTRLDVLDSTVRALESEN